MDRKHHTLLQGSSSPWQDYQGIVKQFQRRQRTAYPTAPSARAPLSASPRFASLLPHLWWLLSFSLLPQLSLLPPSPLRPQPVHPRSPNTSASAFKHCSAIVSTAEEDVKSSGASTHAHIRRSFCFVFVCFLGLSVNLGSLAVGGGGCHRLNLSSQNPRSQSCASAQGGPVSEGETNKTENDATMQRARGYILPSNTYRTKGTPGCL